MLLSTLILLLSVLMDSHGMRRGYKMNKPSDRYLNRPRDPTRCWKVAYLIPFLGTVCSDPNCLKVPCDHLGKIDRSTGHRIKEIKFPGIENVLILLNQLQQKKELFSTQMTPSKNPATLKPDIMYFLFVAFMVIFLLCSFPVFARIYSAIVARRT